MKYDNQDFIKCQNPACTQKNPQPRSAFYLHRFSRCKSCLRREQRFRQNTYNAKTKRVNVLTLSYLHPAQECENCYLNTRDMEQCQVIAGAESIKECPIYINWKHSGIHPIARHEEKK